MSPPDATPNNRSARVSWPSNRRRIAVPAAVAVAALAGQMAGGTYTVKKGDTLWSLARANGTTVNALVDLNAIDNPDLILIDQQLKMTGQTASAGASDHDDAAPARPRPQRPADDAPERPERPATADAPVADEAPEAAPEPPAATAGGSHTVAPGDTLWAIAQANGTTVAVLKDVNGLKGNRVRVGQVIELPSNGPSPEPTPTPDTVDPQPAASTTVSATPTVVSIYRVQPGDTATSIAALFGLSVESLLEANQLSSGGDIEVGQYVRIPSTR